MESSFPKNLRETNNIPPKQESKQEETPKERNSHEETTKPRNQECCKGTKPVEYLYKYKYKYEFPPNRSNNSPKPDITPQAVDVKTKLFGLTSPSLTIPVQIH